MLFIEETCSRNMAKIFLDANYFIDLVEKRKSLDRKQFLQHELYLSPVSIQIYAYIYKIKIPSQKLEEVLDKINITSLEESEIKNSLSGPTYDFEDNLQLHSAAESECDLFLTSDKALLSLRFFGKTRITTQILN